MRHPLQDYVLLMDAGEPESCSEAMEHQHSQEWLKAMEQGCYGLMEPPIWIGRERFVGVVPPIWTYRLKGKKPHIAWVACKNTQKIFLSWKSKACGNILMCGIRRCGSLLVPEKWVHKGLYLLSIKEGLWMWRTKHKKKLREEAVSHQKKRGREKKRRLEGASFKKRILKNVDRRSSLNLELELFH